MEEPNINKMSADEWRRVLIGAHPMMYKARRLFSHLPADPRCQMCCSPFGGIMGRIMKQLGRGQYSKNPRFCMACLNAPVEGTEVEITMLFADVRGSTGLAERMSASEFGGLMGRFYHAATHVLVDSLAIVDKFVGDEVIGLFIPGFAGADHARKAVEAAEGLLRATGHGQGDPWLPIGAGVHTGTAFVSLVGSQGGIGDFTALGDNMNIAARLASSAGPGEILVSEATWNKAGLTSGTERRTLELKGRSGPVEVQVIRV